MLEVICLTAMAPFCVSEHYQRTVSLRGSFSAHLPGEMTADDHAREALGVSISRLFPHTPLDVDVAQVRELCHESICVRFRLSCQEDGLACVWSQAKVGNYRGGATTTDGLRIDARSVEAMAAAKDNIWFEIAGVRISLTNADLSPFISTSR